MGGEKNPISGVTGNPGMCYELNTSYGQNNRLGMATVSPLSFRGHPLAVGAVLVTCSLGWADFALTIFLVAAAACAFVLRLVSLTYAG